MAEQIPSWFYFIVSLAFVGLIGWLTKTVWNKITGLEKELNEVKALYVSQRQFDRVMDELKIDQRETNERLHEIQMLLVKLAGGDA